MPFSATVTPTPCRLEVTIIYFEIHKQICFVWLIINCFEISTRRAYTTNTDTKFALRSPKAKNLPFFQVLKINP